MNQKQKILKLLSDGREHSNVELNDICFRYGARIFEIRKEGIVIDITRSAEHGVKYYQLKTPPNLIYVLMGS